MQPRVTAILVARNGAKHLERTLEALRRQTRPPDTIITVDCGSTDATARLLTQFGPTHVISAASELSFGEAIASALKVIPAPQSEHEMLWLLAQDSAPEPGSLASLLDALEIAPSVAVVGPKVMEWVAGDYIHDFGESVTPYGTTVTLVESELDQGQHDGLSDVLAVSAGGMLVRHTVWNDLAGFDPGLPTIDDSLDFCIRVRLAGYRVSVVPSARVASAGAGVAGPNQSNRGRLRRRRLRAERAAQLHRRLVYAPAAALPVHWLSLIPLALIRSIGQLLRKEPGAIFGEFSAAFGAAFHGLRVRGARKRFAATRTLGWASIATLRVSSAEVRRRLSLKREYSLTGVRGDRPEIRFLSGGGAWTVLAAFVFGAAILTPLIGATTLTGGGLLPLAGTPAELWASVGYGWRDVGLGFVGAADPFAVVLAVLGSLTFWAPSFALVLLYIVAVPLAALGAWLAATRLSERGSLRAIAAALWVLAPTFLSAIAEGKPAAILVHLLLPWLFFAGFAAARSWSASASAALLFAAILACAPSLAPALLIGWLLSVVFSGRSIMRFIGIPLPALALAFPLIVDQSLRGNWLALLADPGVPVPGPEVSLWQLLLGFPAGQFGGWVPALNTLGMPDSLAALAVPLLLAPLALLAALSVFLPGARAASFALLTSLLGFGTAVAASNLFLASSGGQVVGVWTGAALSLYWLGLVGAIVLALRGMPRFALAPALAAIAALVVVAAPLAAALPLGTSVVSEGIDRTQPAFVAAEAQIEPRVGTLQITPQPDGGIRATLVRGGGATLTQQSTLDSTDEDLGPRQSELAVLAGNLASRSGLDASAGLAEFGIRFVVLQQPTSPRNGAATTPTAPTAPATPAATETALRTETALDGNAALAPVGDTSFGRLWQSKTPTDAATVGAIPTQAGGFFGFVTLVVAAVVIGATVLLSIPTGAGREAVRQANRDAIRQAVRATVKQKRRFRRPKSAPLLPAPTTLEQEGGAFTAAEPGEDEFDPSTPDEADPVSPHDNEQATDAADPDTADTEERDNAR